MAHTWTVGAPGEARGEGLRHRREDDRVPPGPLRRDVHRRRAAFLGHGAHVDRGRVRSQVPAGDLRDLRAEDGPALRRLAELQDRAVLSALVAVALAVAPTR